MIRHATPADTSALLALCEESGLFGPNEMEFLGAMLAEHFGGNSDQNWLVDEDDTLVSVALYAPERMTEGTWNLLLIAVRPDRQGQGRGSALLRHIEHALATRGERVLLVETSGLPNFERARAFYRQGRYDEEARIRDYYKAGDDKIIFRKALKVEPKP